MKNIYDLCVCGAGAIGLSIAFLASKSGANVIVFDRSEIGNESSWAGAGILPSPPQRNLEDPLAKLQQLSYQTHFDWHRELLDRTGIDSELRISGGFHLASTRAESATLLASQAWWQEHGIPSERISIDDLHRLEGRILTDRLIDDAVWYLPIEAQLRNPKHLHALRESCQQLGVTFLEQAVLSRMDQASHRLKSILAGEQWISADQYCFCTGAWSRIVGELIDTHLEVFPVRGQMVLYKTPTPWLTRIVYEGHRYMVPRIDGHLLVGSSEEEVGFDKATTHETIDELIAWATGWLPNLATLQPKRTWSGLRPASVDGLPYIGRIPTLDNAFVAAGHFRWGLYLSTGTALMMDAMLRGEPSPIDANPFRVMRGFTS